MNLNAQLNKSLMKNKTFKTKKNKKKFILSGKKKMKL